MKHKAYSIDRMVKNITKNTANFYQIPVEKAARIYLMSALKQVEFYAQNQQENCSCRCECEDDFDPIDHLCPSPLDPRCSMDAWNLGNAAK